jgi:hypothetical protein
MRTCLSGVAVGLYLAAALQVMADRMTVDKTLRVAEAWLDESTNRLGVQLSARITGITPQNDSEGNTLYTVVNLEGGGFLVMSADDFNEPAIAFSDRGPFVASQQNPLYALLVRDMPVRAARARAWGQAIARLGSSDEDARRIVDHDGMRARMKWRALQSRNNPAVSLSDRLAVADVVPITVSEFRRLHATDFLWTPSTVQENDNALLTGSLAGSGDPVGLVPGVGTVQEVRVAPLLGSQWNQKNVTNQTGGLLACYNYYTPHDASGTITEGSTGNWPCGCVATAIGQMMRFHEFPASMAGPDVPLRPQEEAVAGNLTTYEREKVGDLLRDLGTATQTSYGQWSSTAPAANVPGAFASYGYANVKLGTDIESQFHLMLRSNLAARKPVFLPIYNNFGGHAVVADGLGVTGGTAYYHINLGWGGVDDAWYSLPFIQTYSVFGIAVYNIMPTESGEIVGARVACQGVGVSGATVDVLDGVALIRSTQTDGNGVFGVVVPPNKTYNVVVKKPGFGPASISAAVGASGELVCGNYWLDELPMTHVTPMAGNYIVPSSVGDEIAFFCQESGDWKIRPKSGSLLKTNWGFNGCVPVRGDFNGDGIMDLAVFYPPTGMWYIWDIAHGTGISSQQWGFSSCVPVPGDYDADGKDDLAVYDAVACKWYIKPVTGNPLIFGLQWGFAGCVPVPGNYGSTLHDDLALYYPPLGNWYVLSLTGQVLANGRNWGYAGCVAVPGDYDGDGVSDLAVYYEPGGVWHIARMDGPVLASPAYWGYPGCKPLSVDYDGGGVADLGVYDINSGCWFVRKLNGTVLLYGGTVE